MEASTLTGTLETLLRDGFVLVFNSETLDVVETGRALIAAGMRNMEVTTRIPGAAGKLGALKRALPGFKAGVASLVDHPRVRARLSARAAGSAPSVEEAIDAGADFLVSAANFRPETYRAHAGRLPIIPGCGSATEIAAQYDLGANLCKLFPAAQLGGPKFLAALDPAIHRLISVMPTGGVGIENIPDYIAAGALIVGGTFGMAPREALAAAEAGDYAPLAAALRRIKETIDACRAKRYPGLDFKTASLARLEASTGRSFNA